MYIRSMPVWFQVLGLPFELCLKKFSLHIFVLLPALLQQYLLLLFIWSFLASREGGAVSVVPIQTLGHACAPGVCGPLSSAFSMAELVGSALNILSLVPRIDFSPPVPFPQLQRMFTNIQQFYIPTPRLMLLFFWVSYLTLPTGLCSPFDVLWFLLTYSVSA